VSNDLENDYKIYFYIFKNINTIELHAKNYTS